MRPPKQWVVIDEVQRMPRLLDSVHRLIETTPVLFALTGSSGRKLKRGASNLLAGRAFVEIKSSTLLSGDDCAFEDTIAREVPDGVPFCISRDPHRKRIGAVRCIHYSQAAEELGLLSTA